MSGRIFSRTLLSVLLILSAGMKSGAQAYGGYTPYSIFGVGDLFQQGTAYNRSMGGVGTATRSNRYVNPINPASVTARDSLSFMADFSAYNENKIFRQGELKSANNTTNIGDLIISFPIWKSSAMMIGIMPYSNTGFGYKYSYEDPDILGKVGNITYTAEGKGAIYQAFAAAGVTFFKRISVGAQFNYYFGQIEKTFSESFTDATYNGATNGNIFQLRAAGAKFGLQYEQPIGTKSTVTVGATYTLATKLKGYVESYRFSIGEVATDSLYYKSDTLGLKGNNVSLASEFSVGINFKYGDRFMAELDYTQSEWNGTGMDTSSGFCGNVVYNPGNVRFSTTTSRAIRFGMEFVPNRNDVRYFYKRIAYRVGACYRNEYYKLDGHDINSLGITIGATIPIYRWYNGLSVGLEFGRRGTTANEMIKENYFNVSVGLNIFDIWFQKPRYE